MRLPFMQNKELFTRREDAITELSDTMGHVAARLQYATRTLVQRSSTSSSSSDSSATCGADGGSKCITPVSEESSQNIAIILGVVIPLACAAIVLIYLHRRHTRQLRHEDLHDPHKSLDFGMEGINPLGAKSQRKQKGNKGPEMSIANLAPPGAARQVKGLSMDMNLGSPYLLPAGLQGSRESIHSMSRSMLDEHDPYRPVTMMRPSVDNDSIRFGRLDDKASVYSASTGKHSAFQDRAGLVANARPMSQSFARRADSLSSPDLNGSSELPPRQFQSSIKRKEPPNLRTNSDKSLPEINEQEISDALPPPPMPVAQPPRSSSYSIAPAPPRKDSISTTRTSRRPQSSFYGADEFVLPDHMGPTINEPQPFDINPAMMFTEPPQDSQVPSIGVSSESLATHQIQQSAPLRGRLSVTATGNRLSVMGLRPLPPDMPEETPELRANRIRSFYKEYFDDSRPNPRGMYEEATYADVLDGVIFDPDSGGYFSANKPFAQGPGRRAMTPPPRARPRVSGNSAVPHTRKFSTMSAGRPRGRSVPKKQLPPPKPLQALMTPHLMKDDSAIFNAADFAPPTSIRDLANGGSRPGTPSSRSFTPLASSFDELTVLPSPHDLRKSGTFTGLDFAPPTKIRDGMLSASDAGSIRSHHSGISAMQNNAIRTGAYRVSRIPSNMVTTRDDLASQLRPTMDMISRA